MSKYLEEQCEMLAAVCKELSEAVDGLSDRLKKTIEQHNELVQAVNDNTDWRCQMMQEMEELEESLAHAEVMFTPDVDAFRDKAKDN